MRSTLWQLVQPVSAFFWSSVPGTLIIHSRLVSCAARFLVLTSLTSMLAGLSAATVTDFGPSRS